MLLARRIVRVDRLPDLAHSPRPDRDMPDESRCSERRGGALVALRDNGFILKRIRRPSGPGVSPGLWPVVCGGIPGPLGTSLHGFRTTTHRATPDKSPQSAQDNMRKWQNNNRMCDCSWRLRARGVAA